MKTLPPPALFACETAATYAPIKVWKNSFEKQIKFVALTRKERSQIWLSACDFERQTSRWRKDAFGKMHYQGKLGRIGLIVLRVLLFDFLNMRSGRLDPSYEAIARKAIVSVRSVAYALAKLKAAGVLNWIRRRCTRLIDGHATIEQDTNAYGLSAPSCWIGYRRAPDPPPPDSDSWGKPESVKALGIEPGDSPGRIKTALEGAPKGSLGEALGRLSKRRNDGKS